MKIVFMGTPDFSAKVLEKLHKRHPVAAVVTAPDKPVGRGYKLQPSALKMKATELGLPIYQYCKVSKEGIEDIRALSPDIVVTAAFGQILSEEFLAIPKFGVLNVHASLLPKYRGSSPIQQAIIDGEEETGITIMRTVKAVDAGDILLQKRVRIEKEETAGEMFDRLAQIGGDAISEAVDIIENGTAEFVPQDESLATHCKMLSKSDGEIDFSRKVGVIDCFVRGMSPWPSAYTHLFGKTLKVFKTEIIEDKDTLSQIGLEFMIDRQKCSGNIFSLSHNGMVVAADSDRGLVVTAGDNDKLIRLKEVQLEGSKRMSDIEFLRGRRIAIGTVLGR